MVDFYEKMRKTLIDMIIAVHDEWKILSKRKKLRNEFQKNKRVAYLQNCEKTIWVVSA